jgi:hypothetical protein
MEVGVCVCVCVCVCVRVRARACAYESAGTGALKFKDPPPPLSLHRDFAGLLSKYLVVCFAPLLATAGIWFTSDEPSIGCETSNS